MARNIVFIPFIKRGETGRHDAYNWSIKSWQKWCDNNHAELFVLEDLLWPEDHMKITWQRWHIFDILDANDIDLGKDGQVAIVDADTIIHPKTPDFFKLTGMNMAGVLNDGDYEWVTRSIHGYSKAFFNEPCSMRTGEYINNGFVVMNEAHRPFCKEVLDFYNKHKEDIIKSYSIIRASTDQTLINILRAKMGVPIAILPRDFNLQDLHRKNLLYVHPQCWWPDNLDNLKNSGWIYHFNSIPKNPLERYAKYWMERLYNEFYPE